MSRDQQVIRSDRATGGLQFRSHAPVFAISRHVERKHQHLSQKFFNLAQKPR
jgi:hypothetical protein